MNLEEIKNITAIVVAVIGLPGALKWVYEYTRKASQERFSLFMKLNKLFSEDADIIQVTQMLDQIAPADSITQAQKYKFLRFYEILAIAVNSKLINPDVAWYKFSYHAIRCDNSEEFWKGLNKDSAYWSLFVSFASEMSKIEEKNLANGVGNSSEMNSIGKLVI